jgi:hypothetical protein
MSDKARVDSEAKECCLNKVIAQQYRSELK